jgi:hypothetical protein
MGIDPLTAIVNGVTTVIDKIFPDANQAAMAKLELAKMQLKGDLDTIVGQLEINKVEAASPSVFVSGWRPFIGWVCGCSFAYKFVIGPVIQQISVAYGYNWPSVDIDMEAMLYVLGGMLGLGGLRTYEKVKGVARQ